MKNIYKKTTAFMFFWLLSAPVFAVPDSDFDFNRADDNPTIFHTNTYGNSLNGNNAAAFQAFVNTEAQALDLTTINARKLDSSKLAISQNQEIKIYFVNESALFRNKLAIQSSGATSLNGIVFNDVSCLETGCGYTETFGEYTLNPDDVLELGDYANVGNIESGSQLNFELITPNETLYSNNSLNPSNKGVIAYEYEGYLILAWEDDQDSDFNDLVFALDIGQDNLDCIPAYGETSNLGCNFADPTNPTSTESTSLFPD